MVTPMILKYGAEKAAVWALAILPAYEMVERVEHQAHWQSDLLAGPAISVAVGYVEHAHGPFILSAIPGGVFVRFQKSLC